MARFTQLTALTAALLLGALACGDEGTADYAVEYYDESPGAGGALYRPLRPANSPGLAGANGATPGSAGTTGSGGAPGFGGRAGAGGFGSDPYADPPYGDPYSSAGRSGSSGF